MAFPAALLGLVANRWVLGGLAIAAAVYGANAWHQGKIRAAVEARDQAWERALEAERAKRRDAVSAWVLELAERDARWRELYNKAAAERRVVFQTILKEVPFYVTPLADSRCVIPRGFVFLHDAAAAGGAPAVPGGSGGLVDSDSGVALSAVGATVAENYGSCHDAFAEVAEWRRWYPEARAWWEGLRAKLSEPMEAPQ